MWKLLASAAREVPESNALNEYASTSTGKSIPIVVSVRGESGEFYTAVLGIHVYGQNDPVGYVLPRLAYYTSSQEGTTRITSLDPHAGESTAEFDQSLLRASIEQHLRQHLFGSTS